MPALPPDKRTRLVRLCGMLGSDFDGERANAGKLADNLVRELQLTWDDVIASVPASTHHRSSRPNDFRQEPPRQDWKPDSDRPETPQETARYCLETPIQWTEWERGFLKDMLFRFSLSPRQDEVLRRLRERAAKFRQRQGR